MIGHGDRHGDVDESAVADETLVNKNLFGFPPTVQRHQGFMASNCTDILIV
jgi:hypothetical protein